MLRQNPLKARLKAGRKCLGVWLAANAPLFAESISDVGFDFALIDHEHGPGDLMGLIGQLQALRSGAGAAAPSSVVRVPWNDQVYIKRVLDTGAEGVMVPMVESAEQARAAVAACKYPPAGSRGVAMGSTRATNFGADAKDYWTRANDEVFVMLQIETPRAVEAIAEIAAVPGCDALFIGPADLTANCGASPLAPTAETQAVIARAEAAIKKAGKPMASVQHSGLSVQQMFDRGYALIMSGTELSILRRAAKAVVDEHRKANP
jgi:4-hydroxy-2-oxoheptanedioate aldolase